MQSESGVCGFEVIILSAFSCKCSSFLKEQFVWFCTEISQAYIKWELNIEWYSEEMFGYIIFNFW